MKVTVPLQLQVELPSSKKGSGGKGMQASAEVSTDEKIPLSERVDAAKRELRKHLQTCGLARVPDHVTRLMMASIRIAATPWDESISGFETKS